MTAGWGDDCFWSLTTGMVSRFRKDGIFGKVFSDVNNWKPD
jgi:hypothetical protein